MNFRFNKSPENCSNCGAPTTTESVSVGIDGKINTHVNGGQWEQRKYACGKVVTFIPNFNCDEVSQPCSRDSKEVEKRMKQDDLYSALQSIVDRSDVDDEYREHLRNCIPRPFRW